MKKGSGPFSCLMLNKVFAVLREKGPDPFFQT